MAIAEQKSPFDGRIWGLFKFPFRHSSSTHASSTSSSSQNTSLQHGLEGHQLHASTAPVSNSSVSSIARSLLPKKHRLRFDPSNKLYFPYEPGKQVRSAIRIKNKSNSHVAFKFQTTAPKSCFMRPPGAILSPGECVIATVFKFVEHPENNERPVEQKSRVKFKILSLKVNNGEMDYAPELFDEQKEQVAVEKILQVVFLDVENPNPRTSRAMNKLLGQLAEVEAEVEARKKPPEDAAAAAAAGPKIIGEGLVIDEWKERRERYLARQQLDATGPDSQ